MLPAVIVALVFGSALMVAKMILDFNREKLLADRSSEGSSLLLSELEDIIDAAVGKAVAPLQERIDELEIRSLPQGPSQKMIEGASEESQAESRED